MTEHIPPIVPRGSENREHFHTKLTLIARELETTKDKEAFKQSLEVFLGDLEDTLGLPLDSHVEHTYRQMEQEKLLLRVENLSKVMESITEHVPLTVGNREDHYANSVIANNAGVKIAFAEAHAPGPVRLLIGFDVKAAVSFKPESLQVFDIDPIEEDLRDTAERKKLCRHVVGNIEPEVIRHMVLRVPKAIFPESKMTEEEQSHQQMYIFRSIDFPTLVAAQEEAVEERELVQ